MGGNKGDLLASTTDERRRWLGERRRYEQRDGRHPPNAELAGQMWTAAWELAGPSTLSIGMRSVFAVQTRAPPARILVSAFSACTTAYRRLLCCRARTDCLRRALGVLRPLLCALATAGRTFAARFLPISTEPAPSDGDLMLAPFGATLVGRTACDRAAAADADTSDEPACTCFTP